MPGSFIRTKRSQPPSNTACSTTDLVRLCLLCEFGTKKSISGMKDLAVGLGISFNYKFYKFCILEILFYTFYSNRNEKTISFFILQKFVFVL